ncbi:DUF2634 domain-containing protein [Clostridium aminobutyricum]|uniref:DUF2634 domain-containing protein n=1 Tax=Clostridium aminobutyricum TaxID=33953 RepID=A0A939IJ31_CLOAM|nr:DUF2634 domain-containing protein [Clostridium aminobutyricum]MBN7773144.1 DUF2634 domain-containing protein [Clostridium aminobutyricum]
MIPKSAIRADLEISETAEKSNTYKLSDEKIQGFVDELEALQQAIYKVLHTEKYEYPIYSFSYGIELDNLIGKELGYVKIELKRRIQECLLLDSRIERVDNFEFTRTGDEIRCTFDVVSIYGKMTITKEVKA